MRCHDVRRAPDIRSRGPGGILAGENDIADSAEMADRVTAPAGGFEAGGIEQVAAHAAGTAEMRTVVGLEIEGDDLMARLQQPFGGVTAKEPSRPGDENPQTASRVEDP